MNAGTIAAYVRLLGQVGLRRTLATLRHRSSERFHERRLGIETEEMVEMRQLGITNAGHAEYAPTPFRDFSAIFDRLAIRDNHDVLIDYGSGKGRALILAARYPFKRIIGVEYSQVLNDIAARNIEVARAHLRCKNVGTVAADASKYDVPDDVTIAYFNNPFHRPLFEEVLARLHASLSANPRQLRLVVNVPPDCQLPAAVKESGWLTIVDAIDLPPDRRCLFAVAGSDPVSPS
jgi:SAM-dependent methyltransferase